MVNRTVGGMYKEGIKLGTKLNDHQKDVLYKYLDQIYYDPFSGGGIYFTINVTK